MSCDESADHPTQILSEHLIGCWNGAACQPRCRLKLTKPLKIRDEEKIIGVVSVLLLDKLYMLAIGFVLWTKSTCRYVLRQARGQHAGSKVAAGTLRMIHPPCACGAPVCRFKEQPHLASRPSIECMMLMTNVLLFHTPHLGLSALRIAMALIYDRISCRIAQVGNVRLGGTGRGGKDPFLLRSRYTPPQVWTCRIPFVNRR